MSYVLSNIPNFVSSLNSVPSNLETDIKYFSVTNYSTKSNENYKIVRYNKELLAADLVDVYGLLRSVIVNTDNQVVSFN